MYVAGLIHIYSILSDLNRTLRRSIAAGKQETANQSTYLIELQSVHRKVLYHLLYTTIHV